MPFTFSHAAAVVPIRKYGVLSALVVGSFAPDLLYFIPHVQKTGFGHTLPGLFLFCLPAGLAVLWLFHTFIKRPMISLFPLAHQQKLLPMAEGFSYFPARRLLQILVSILIGAASHITWDLFTHSDSWLVQRVAFLRMRFVLDPTHVVNMPTLLQHLTSLLGLAVIVFYYYRWLRNTPSSHAVLRTHLSPFTRVLLLATFAAGALLPTVARLISDPLTWQAGRINFLGHTMITALKMVTLEVIFFSLVWHFVNLIRQNRSSEPVSD